MALRVYNITAAGVTLANQAVTLTFFNPVSGTSVEVLRNWVSQSANATSAQQRVQTNFQASVFPTLTSTTPAKTNSGDGASGIVGGTAGAAGTSGTNASAEGAGTKTVIFNDSFNVLNGYLWVPTPGETHIVRAADSLGYGLHVPVAPATLTNWQFGTTYREV